MPITLPHAPGAKRRGSRRWFGPLLLAAAVAASGRAYADDGILTWIVKSISSNEDGEIIPASALQVPQAGAALPTGQLISTRAGQHMVLVNGRDLVEVRPNSTVTIGDNDPATPLANVDVKAGTIHVEVGKRAPGQSFSIGATYLIATVKGTRFDVSTSSEESAVSVTEGIVAISSLASGESIDVTAGNTAVVGRRTLGAPTPANSAPSVIEVDGNIENASVSADGDPGGSSSDGSNSGGSNSGGSQSGGGLGGAVGGAAEKAGSAVGGASEKVGGAVGGASEKVGGAVGGAAGGLGGAVGGAAGGLGGAVGGPVGGAVGGAGGAVGGAVGGAGGAVGGAVGGAGGAMGGAVGGLGGAVGGLLGGKK